MDKIYKLIAKMILADKKRARIAAAIFVPLCVGVILLSGGLLLQNAFTSAQLNCQYTEHQHSAECYSDDDSLVCELEEHSHEDLCYGNKDETEATEAGSVGKTDAPCHYCERNLPHGCAYGSVVAPAETGKHGIAPRSAGDRWDMYNYVTGIVIRDSNGQAVTNGSFYYNQPYSFNISFAERTGANGQFGYNESSRLVYKLPDELMVLAPITDGVILLSNGSPVGHYTISIDGYVELWFDELDNQGNAIDYNFIDRYTDVRFNLNISAQFKESAQNGQIWFGADAAVTVDLSDLSAELKLEKSASALNLSNETIDYEIKITAIANTVKNITLTDTLEFGNGFKLKAGEGYSYPFTNLQYRLPGGEWTNAVFTWNAALEGWVLNLPENTTLKANESIHVKYTLNLSGVMDYLDSLDGNAHIPRLSYDTQLNNKATASGEDKSGRELFSSDITSTAAKKTFLTKKGSYKDSDNKITWTAVIGDGSIKLNKKTISDSWAATPKQNLTSQISIKLYDQSGNLLQTVAIAAPYNSNGFNSSGNGFTYLVPESPENIFKLEIIYDVSITPPDTGSVKYSNKIAFESAEKTADVEVTPSGSSGNLADIKVNKSSEWIRSNGKEVSDIKYTIEITVPAGNKDALFFLKDDLELTTPANSGIHYGRVLHTRGSVDNFSLSLEPAPNGSAADPALIWAAKPASLRTSGKSGTNDYAENNTTFLWDVYFGAQAESSLNYRDSKWQYSDQKTILISYTVSLDSKITGSRADAAYEQYKQYVGKTIWDVLNVPGFSLGNRIGIYNSQNSSIKYSDTNDYFPIQKESNSSNSSNTLFDYTVYLNWSPWSYSAGNPATNKYSLFTQGNAIFEDSFDSRLEYVPGSFYVEQFSGTNSNVTAIYGPYNSSSNPRSDLVVTDGNTIRVDFSKGFLQFALSPSWNASPLTSPLLGANGTIQNANWYYNNLNRFKVHYQLRLKSDASQAYPEEAQILNNTASIYCSSADLSGKWSDSSAVTYAPKAVTKDMSIDGSLAQVEIVINPDGKRLRPLGVSNQQFTAVDTMNGELAFYLNTIEFFTQTKTAGGWDGVWTQVEIQQHPDLWSINCIDPQTVEFELPDEQPVKIVYTALITAPQGSTTAFSNKIEVYGYSDIVFEDAFQVMESDMDAFGDDRRISLFKEDELSAARLTGAGFSLYIYTDGSSYDGEPHDSITPPGSGMAFYKLCDAQYQNGAYVLNSNWITPNHKAVYMVVETKAPSGGYILPNEPYSFFILHSTDSAEIAALEAQLKRPLTLAPDNLYITNRRPVLSELVIGGKKQVSGYNAPDATFSFTMTQVANEDGDEYTPASEAIIRTRSIKTNGSGTYSFSFPKITDLSAGVYYFKVEENAMASSLWRYDSRVHIVKLEISGDPLEAVIDVTTSDSGEIVFINSYGNPAFPMVGGIGTQPFVVAAVLISLFLTGALIYTLSKRRRCLISRAC